MIPKIIHYCWFGEKKLPNDVKKCIKSWKKMCPDYEIIQWNEKNFDINCCEFVEQAYKTKAWAFVSDYARLKIIYDNGGIYLDTDVELKRNLDSLLEEECYFGVQQEGKYIATGLGFGSVKNNNIIKEMLEMVQKIMKNGYAYETSTAIYFDISKLDKYPILSNLDINEQKAGARVDIDPEKRNPYDFALWIKAPENHLMKWDSPWGPSYPGWHIECSAMGQKYLGEQFDIHTGGIDLIPTHHENEIAQSEAATGKAFSHYWMHNGYINIDNKKMSKSLGNFFTVREVAEQYGYEVIRYMMIQAHYRSPINYCKELLDACKASLERLYTCRDTLDRAIAAAPAGDCSEAAKELFAQREQQFITAMDDDLNTADGITALFELARELNRMSADATTSKGQLEAGAKLFDSLTDVLGILYQRKQEDTIPAEVQTLIEERAAARKAKNFAEADRLRDAIAALGYRVKETRQGTQIEKL